MSAPCKAPVRPAPEAAGAVPPGLVCIPLGKRCILLLPEREYIRGLRLGRRWKRAQALRRREGANP
jgi:hypothetical protein